jgi:hypothetical protein
MIDLESFSSTLQFFFYPEKIRETFFDIFLVEILLKFTLKKNLEYIFRNFSHVRRVKKKNIENEKKNYHKFEPKM